MSKIICIEIGSWHFRSSRAIADNLPENGVLYCVDTWNGSKTEEQWHGSAKWMDGDHAYYECLQNSFDLIQQGKVVLLRMTSENAAKFFKEKNIKADFIFIDADHTYEGCKKDIEIWKDLLKDDGIFSGHDFNGWAGVNQAVEESMEKFSVDPNCTIWYCGKKDIKTEKPKVYDAFLYNGEGNILEARLTEMWEVVDRFVICEAKFNHANKPKPLYFNDNLKRFEKFLSKITYLVVEEFPQGEGDSWYCERFQRDYLMNGLTNCKDSDIIILGDCDEIAKATSIKEFNPEKVIMNFEQDFYYYNFNCKSEQKWDWLKITTYKNLKEKTPCGVRYTPFTLTDHTIKNGGWHFSYFGNIDDIIRKISDTAHQEYNNSTMKNRDRIIDAVKNGKDIFGREDLKYKFVEIDDSYPKYVLDNIDELKKKGLIL